MNYHPNPQKRALHFNRRSWWMCCYGIRPSFDPKTKRWRVHIDEWEGNRKWWTLMDIKTFETPADALASKSYRKSYAPFDNPFVRVMLMPRTLRSIRRLTEFRLYDQEENAMAREFTFYAQRTITVLAEDEAEAAKKVEAELHDGESIIGAADEDAYEVTVVAVIE